MNTFDPNQFSNNCAPIHSDDSIFFNLILNSNYENSKENCLLFLRNYSKQILYTKRDIFRIIINELTLGEQTNLDIRKDESIYLIHQIIRKYSRNNIINALYDFISMNEDENGNENENENNLIDQEKNSNTTTNDFTNDKSQNQERDQSKKDIQNIMDITNKKENKKKDKKESDMKENENSIENGGDGDIFDNDKISDINSSKLLKFLEKKRKSTSFKKDKKDKKTKKEQKEKKENQDKEEKDDKNGEKSKKGEKKEKEKAKEHKNGNKKDYEKEQLKEEERENRFNEKEMQKNDSNEEKEKEKLRMDYYGYSKRKKEKKNSIIKKEIDDFEKEVKEKMHIKKKKNILNEENEGAKYQRKSYKNRIRYISSISPLKSFVSKSTRRIISPIEIIKLESGEDLNFDSNITIFPMKNRKSKDRRRSANQIDILSYLNMNQSKDSKPINDQEKQFGNHLIKDPKNQEFIYSYRIKKYQNFKNNNIILFECNNNKCQGRGEYDIERKIFRETVEHNVPANFHKLAFAHYNVKQTLLMDNCLGYQLFKDNNNFIKDKKVITLNNK